MRRILAVVGLSALLSSCSSTAATPEPASSPAAPTAAKPAQDGAAQGAEAEAAKAADEAKKKAEERKKKQKELRQKQRELDHARVEQRVQVIEHDSRKMSVAAALERTAADLEAAQRDLDVFLKEVKPRELDERRISLDGSVYHAEHQKDELGELTAMYEADEFARTTKELVLKRGRRSMEMADRRLAIERREFAHFEQVELPRRERELRQKVADAELAKRKAELEDGKTRLELELAVRKTAERQSDLGQEIRELEEALAGEKP